MAENFENTIDALMKGVEEHVSTKTIVGEPIIQGDIIIFPMADVSFGIAAGSFDQEKKNNGVGGVGAKMSPSAVLVVQNGTSKIINVKDKDSLNKIIDMIPDLFNKLTESIGKKDKDTDAEAAAGAGPEAEA